MPAEGWQEAGPQAEDLLMADEWDIDKQTPEGKRKLRLQILCTLIGTDEYPKKEHGTELLADCQKLYEWVQGN